MTDPIFPLRIDPTEKAEWQEYADKHGAPSLSEFIKSCVRAEIDGDTATAELRAELTAEKTLTAELTVGLRDLRAKVDELLKHRVDEWLKR